MTNEVSTIEQPPDNPITQALAALRSGVSPEQLGQLMTLQERWEANNARKAFAVAMAKFKENPPEILKDKRVCYTTQKGTTDYMHATLGGVCEAIIKGLAGVGISHRWVVDQSQRIKVTCVLTHADGHSESVKLSAAPDESCGKNSIQAIASSVSYLQRYTLLSATGMATQDIDDDGKAAEPILLITDSQVADLMALADEVKADRAKFLQYMNVEKLADIPVDQFKRAITALESKRGR